MEITTIITAAGKNTRMQKDLKEKNLKSTHKLLLKIKNKPIIIHTIEAVLKSKSNKCILALGYQHQEIIKTIEEYDLINKLEIRINPYDNLKLTETINNTLKTNPNEYYLFTAGDQPTITTNTINKLIKVLENSKNPKTTVSILARLKTGKLKTAKGLGMPLACYGNLLYKYTKNYKGNLNPLLLEMINNNINFYGIKSENELELININHYNEYLYVKKEKEEINKL
ncbi:MAG: NTP transferase domain-containing protein [Methanobacteriaceae archaeon]|nr:NTP transferase domain-containing protein [Methanobacteriaceae archaeon]